MTTRDVTSRIRNNLLVIERLMNSDNYDEAKMRAAQSLINLRRIRSTLTNNVYSTVKSSLDSLITICNNKIQERLNSSTSVLAYSAPRNKSGKRGRPNLIISKEQIEFFLSEGYTATKIAKILKCSSTAVYKKIYEYGLKIRSRYSLISDEDLLMKIDDLQKQYPNSGSKMMCGYLLNEGLCIQRSKVRNMLTQVNPEGVALRWGRTVNRRVYNVPTPNSLWHMDAHLKLSRWGFVTHGCIDGFSRLITYIQCTTSITAKTVINLFVPAIIEYGLPSRVRSDHGYENIFVALLMNATRGLNRGSHITGRSVHNQRIERLWRDVHEQIISQFYEEFYSLENENLLDPNNETHKYFLQKIYLNVINNRLRAFQFAWNVHKIRTENNKCPRELWLSGLLENMNSQHTAVTEIFGNNNSIHERITNAFSGFNDQQVITEITTSRFTASSNLNEEQEEVFLNILIDENIPEPKLKFIAALQLI